MHKEISDALQRKKDEEEVEMRRKQELIRQIRELEKIPIQRTKGFDPTVERTHYLKNLQIDVSVFHMVIQHEISQKYCLLCYPIISILFVVSLVTLLVALLLALLVALLAPLLE